MPKCIKKLFFASLFFFLLILGFNSVSLAQTNKTPGWHTVYLFLRQSLRSANLYRCTGFVSQKEWGGFVLKLHFLMAQTLKSSAMKSRSINSLSHLKTLTTSLISRTSTWWFSLDFSTTPMKAQFWVALLETDFILALAWSINWCRVFGCATTTYIAMAPANT